ncbi:MAG: hypothetical protein LBI60_03335 [Bacteroidales bacterium]|jgi:hypothetical protein|nr:hypothetical protein [Bacteroidales bacterium]
MNKKLRIDFQKLINKTHYLGYEILLIYQWLINIGKKCDIRTGWNRYGLHQAFHGYSYNNEPDKIIPLGLDWEYIIHSGFVNLLCNTNNHKIVIDFLKENNISIGKIRIISVKDQELNRKYFTDKAGRYADSLHYLTTAYKGLELKKEYFPPDYGKRTRPRIIENATFGTNGEKWFVSFPFSFENIDYEPGWDYTIAKEEAESLPDFFDRAIETIDNLLVDTDNCDNCPYWIECEHHGYYLRYGYRGNCRQHGKCKKEGVIKHKWYTENGRSCDNATHHSIAYPYYRTRK